MVHPDDPTQGILIDLDLAARVNLDGTPVAGFLPQYGTIPFRAIDVLHEDAPSVSYYRQDLESFFYVMIFILQRRTDVMPEEVFSRWISGPWGHMKTSKSSFFASHEEEFLPEIPLMSEWVRNLRKMFHQGYSAKWRAEANALLKREGEKLDEDSLGGLVTYERFLEALGENKAAGA